jgi:hypothetical protein
MISKFLREQKRYTQKELCDILECSNENVVGIIRRLKEFGVLKTVKLNDKQKDMSDLLEEDIEVVNVEIGENEFLYVFTFVGVITIAGIILKCYPKYILNNTEPKEELKQILKVLEKYNSKEQIIYMFNDINEDKTFNLLAVYLFLLKDYYENGLYTNSEEIIEINGSGEIIWDRTINESYALINNNRPYYDELKTRRNIEDENDYFRKLHEYILSIAIKELKEADLLELFEITEIELPVEESTELSDFGDKEYILYRIENELKIQFDTRKQQLLKTLYAYVKNSSHLYYSECFSMFGTNSFNLVWEKVCAEILDNKLNQSISALKLPITLNEKYNKDMKLSELIEKPYWSIPNKKSNDTLIPDFISITKNNGIVQFIIFDAKYYNPIIEEGKELKGQPGIESITKQYLYQLAYKNFIEEHNIQIVKNCFLIPTEKEEIIDKGYVSLEMLDKIGLQKIQIRMIPAKRAYDYYLKGKELDINELKLI